MKQRNWITALLSVLITLGMSSGTAFTENLQPVTLMEQEITQGALRVEIDEQIIECPLKHTDVKANISGFIARVTVTQTFHNPYDEKIEAVYVFPLPHTAAIDDMTMTVGDRRIVGLIKRRAEAQALYQEAIQQGKTASLLEQERPNIFTQSVGNIQPNDEVRIEISYVDVLDYDIGTYEFHFPMVVGPRYIPGTPTSKKPELPNELKGKVGESEAPFDAPLDSADPSGTGVAPDTNRVPDASRITPPVLKPGYRTAHDISLAVSLDAGVPIQDIQIVNHKADVDRVDASGATAVLSPADSIPNKDFVMKYAVVGKKPEMAVLAHSQVPKQGYFMLMIQPKLDAELAEAPPREIVFLVDVSGSMRGEPTQKVKETMHHFLRLTKPKDTVQVITFSNRANKLFEKPVPAIQANIEHALNFTQQMWSGGGTEMLNAIKLVLNEPIDQERVRIVVMLTDGYIGNEAEIIAEIDRRAGDQIRFSAIGIGTSPNRYLIDGVAKHGGGLAEVIELNTDPGPLVAQIAERIHRAQLAKIQIDWNGLSVYETYPRRIPELWAGRPVLMFGRYSAGGSEKIELSGSAEGKPLKYKLHVTLPDAQPAHDVLSKVWARKKIEDISARLHAADAPEIIEEITNIALTHRLMTQYTSFVAVDENDMQPINQEAKAPRQVMVPVPLPEGTDYQGFYNQRTRVAASSLGQMVKRRAAPMVSSAPTAQYSVSVDRGTTIEALQAEANPQATGILSEVERTSVQPEFLRNSLIVPSWRLLAGAIDGKIDKEALTTLQKAWEDSRLEAIITGGNQYIAVRSAWCIRTAAQAVPNDVGLTALSERVLSKVTKIKLPKPQDNLSAYLSTLYAILASQGDADKDLAKSLLMRMDKNAYINMKTARLIAEGLLKPSAGNDKALQAALSTHDIYGDDLVLLTCLVAKSRGGQLWQTFREEFPHIARQSRLNGHIAVIISRLEASHKGIQFSAKR
ncbi:VWA domain-containing protein [Candidatus Poribacteria bacterium]|nr:VWA domain-containing protein [Candidatus Poribacteria bacterium]MYG06519.1 VWA domain-containing protein [Candidatus Poribacteria bacterium]MYK22071.1 VWA domain-containing protein [Candidatus Poribacteria bacterium]